MSILFVQTTIPHRETVVHKMTIEDIRRRNLKALIKQWGGPTTLAKKLQYSGPSYLSQIMSGGRGITEKTAHSIEAALGLPLGWMDQEPATRTSPQERVNTVLLGRVMTMVGEVLREQRATVSAERMAEIVTLIYEDVQAKGDVDEVFVNRIVKLVTKE